MLCGRACFLARNKERMDSFAVRATSSFSRPGWSPTEDRLSVKSCFMRMGSQAVNYKLSCEASILSFNKHFRV